MPAVNNAERLVGYTVLRSGNYLGTVENKVQMMHCVEPATRGGFIFHPARNSSERTRKNKGSRWLPTAKKEPAYKQLPIGEPRSATPERVAAQYLGV